MVTVCSMIFLFSSCIAEAIVSAFISVDMITVLSRATMASGTTGSGISGGAGGGIGSGSGVGSGTGIGGAGSGSGAGSGVGIGAGIGSGSGTGSTIGFGMMGGSGTGGCGISCTTGAGSLRIKNHQYPAAPAPTNAISTAARMMVVGLNLLCRCGICTWNSCCCCSPAFVPGSSTGWSRSNVGGIGISTFSLNGSFSKVGGAGGTGGGMCAVKGSAPAGFCGILPSCPFARRTSSSMVCVRNVLSSTTGSLFGTEVCSFSFCIRWHSVAISISLS